MSSLRFHSLKAFNARIVTRNIFFRFRTAKAYKTLQSDGLYHISDSTCHLSKIRQPYKNLMILLVGRSHCAEAIDDLKEMAFRLARLVARQCKVHAGQKVHQSLQFYSFYSRMWGEEMTQKMLLGVKRSLLMHGKRLVLSAVCLLPYDWKNNKISNKKLERSVVELDSIDELCSATVYCQDCKMRQVIDKKLPDIDYCTCKGGIGYTSKSRHYESWESFLERENILVWRKPNEDFPHLFAYKVFGTYDDMSLSAFMEVQLNTEFRTEWDSTALELKVLSSHPESNSDLIYWRVKFPQFFANRDYVFKRRFRVNEEKKEVVIISELAKHEQVPEIAGLHRVADYWSIMVLRANSDFHEPGMSYTLTYFDNPGTNLPAVVTSFIATTAFPDYLRRVYQAAVNLQHRWENGEDVYMTLPTKLRYRYPRTPLLPTVILPEAESKDVELFDIRSDQHDDREGQKQLKAIGDALRNSDKSDKNLLTKILLKHKKVIVDLLEAMEIVPPDLEGKTKLAARIEKLVDKLNLEKAKKILLLNKLREIKKKTKKFLEGSAKKKEESMKSMKKFEVGRSYYDHTDERTVSLIKGLFKAINDVMELDKDMRIGKDLVTADNSKLAENFILNAFNGNKKKGTINKADCDVQNEFDQNHVKSFQKDDVVECPCCACDNINLNKSSWYSFFIISSWWSSGNSSSDKFCDSCVCDHKANNALNSDGQNQANMKAGKVPNESLAPPNNTVITNKENSDSSYWRYLYIWLYIPNPFNFQSCSMSAAPPDKLYDHDLKNNTSLVKSAADDISKEEPLSNDTENNVSWYWMPIKISYDLFTWLFGSSTAKEPG